MNLTVNISTYPTADYSYEIDIIEDYEGDKWHVAVHETSTVPYEYYDSRGFNTEKEVFEYIRELQKENY